MTAREFKQKVTTSVNMEKEEEQALEEIRWREHKSMSAVIRIAIQEHIRLHSEGNNTFKLDKWNEDPNFKAVPTILSQLEIWYKYLQECSPQERLRIQIQTNRINKQCVNINSQNKF